MSLPQTHTHPNPLQTLAPHLLPHLPHSLPLLRRLQFHCSSTSARTLATFPPDPSQPPPHHFTATYVDRTRAPETECWIFSTYEVPAPQKESSTSSHQQPEHHDPPTEAKSHLLALLHAISQLPSPNPLIVIGTFPETLLPLLSGGADLQAQPVVTRDIPGNRNASSSRDCVLAGLSVPYRKWLITSPDTTTHESQGRDGDRDLDTLPRDHVFSSIRREELALTMSRTSIPKTEETLAQLGSVGIRYVPSSSTAPATTAQKKVAVEKPNTEPSTPPHGELIAWAFIGVDGSLTSLHVEPAHRGRGLAKAVTSKLFTQLARDPVVIGFRNVGGEYQEPGSDDGDDESEGGGGGGGSEFGGGHERMMGWAHSDVAVGNEESAGVVRGLGGREGWVIRWVGVDLGRVEVLVRGMER